MSEGKCKTVTLGKEDDCLAGRALAGMEKVDVITVDVITGEGTNPVTGPPIAVARVLTGPDVCTILALQHATRVLAPMRCAAFRDERLGSHLIFKDQAAAVKDDLFCSVIRYGCDEDLIFVCQHLRPA